MPVAGVRAGIAQGDCPTAHNFAGGNIPAPDVVVAVAVAAAGASALSLPDIAAELIHADRIHADTTGVTALSDAPPAGDFEAPDGFDSDVGLPAHTDVCSDFRSEIGPRREQLRRAAVCRLPSLKAVLPGWI